MNHQQAVEEIFQRICADLSMIADRPFEVQKVDSQRASARVNGGRSVQISFKLGFQHKGRILHGCMLVPLADAITLASYLMLVPDDAVKAKRGLTTLDTGLKDAMIEIGNFVGGAVDAALRSAGVGELRVRSESCQGVKPNTRPAFTYEEGAPLIVGRAKLQLGTWPAFEAILMLPELDVPAPAAA